MHMCGKPGAQVGIEWSDVDLWKVISTILISSRNLDDQIHAFISLMNNILVVSHTSFLNTVNDESLAVLKFGESAKKSIWRKKVWRNFHPRSQVIFMF